MTIESCPYCGGEFEVEPEWFGRMLECPYCAKKYKLGEAQSNAVAVPRLKNTNVSCAETYEHSEQNTSQKMKRPMIALTSVVALTISIASMIIALIALVVSIRAGNANKPEISSKTQESSASNAVVKPMNSAAKVTKKRQIDRVFKFKIPPNTKLKPNMAPTLFDAEKPSQGAVMVARIQISSRTPIELIPRQYKNITDNLRSVTVATYINDDDVWRHSEFFNGYAGKDTAIGRRLLKMLEDGKYHPCLIHLKPAWYTKTFQDSEIVDLEEIEATEID